MLSVDLVLQQAIRLERCRLGKIAKKWNFFINQFKYTVITDDYHKATKC